MERIVVALVLAAVAAGIAVLTDRRRRHDAPTQPRTYAAPLQVDRAEFVRPDAEWLVLAFTSSTCGTCADVAAKVAVLEGPEVAVEVVDSVAQRDLHVRYQIEAVPIVAVAGADGVVQASFVGPVSATHLWGALAELREPGSVPEGCGAGGHGPSDDGAAPDEDPVDGATRADP
ncbi:MAG: thioredoxin family protein [Actinomycetes bacterium]